MTKSTSTSSPSTQILLLIAVFLVAGFFWVAKSSLTTIPATTLPTVGTVTGTNDLDQAQDQLNAVSVDGVDTGLNQLNTEVSNF